MEKDWYKVLGVERDARADEIKSAYRELALQCHPDRNPGSEEAARQFMLIQAAYEVLADPRERELYDRELQARAESLRAALKPAWEPPPMSSSSRRERETARGLTGRQFFGRVLIVIGALMAFRGFLGTYLGPYNPVALWLGGGQERSFLFYLGGTLVGFLGAATLMQRGGD